MSFAPGIEQIITTLPRLLEVGVGGFEVLLQLLPDPGVVVAVAIELCLVQPRQFLDQRFQLRGDGLEASLLFGLIRLQAIEPFRALPMTFNEGAVVALGSIALGDQRGLALFQRPHRGFQLFDGLAQLRFLTAAGHHRFAQFQQPAPQRFCLIAVAAAAEAQTAAAIGEAAPGHGTAFFQQLTIQGDGAGAAEALTGRREVLEHQRVSEDVGEHHVVDRFVAHQLHGTADQPLTMVSVWAAATGHGCIAAP